MSKEQEAGELCFYSRIHHAGLLLSASCHQDLLSVKYQAEFVDVIIAQ